MPEVIYVHLLPQTNKNITYIRRSYLFLKYHNYIPIKMKYYTVTFFKSNSNNEEWTKIIFQGLQWIDATIDAERGGS